MQERLEREYGLSLLLSAPRCSYDVVLENGEEIWVDNPSLLPDPSASRASYEPYIKAAVMIPERYLGAVMELCRERRGVETPRSTTWPSAASS